MEATTERSARAPLTARSPEVHFDPQLERHWVGGYRVPTALINGVNLLFPKGERFFVRSVWKYLPRLDDAALREAVRGFAGQEGHHAREHERFFALLEKQGYELEGFLRFYESFAYGFVEKHSPAWLALSTTAACEHLTAVLAETALTVRFLDLVDPAMRRLLYWHAVEELEHKSVAFDVLARCEPGYAKRMAGAALAAGLLGSLWFAATTMLLRQDRSLPAARVNTAPLPPERKRQGPLRLLARGLRAYVRPGFHPDHTDHRALIERTLRELELQ